MIRVTTLALGAWLGWWTVASGAQSVDEESEPVTADAEAVEEDEDDEDIEPVIVDGVFTPSEKIEADSEISFPADI